MVTNRVSREKYTFYNRISVDDKSATIRAAIHCKNFFLVDEELLELHFSRRMMSLRRDGMRFFSDKEDDVAFYDASFDFLHDFRQNGLPNIWRMQSSAFLRVSFMRILPIGTDRLRLLDFIFPVTKVTLKIREKIRFEFMTDICQNFFSNSNNSLKRKYTKAYIRCPISIIIH